MAQFLKEEQRQAIIEAARQELREKGYQDASMRSIAAKAEMTVGNLYRYFKNKEEIQEHIVSHARDEIDDILRELTVDTVSKEARVFSIKTDVNELSKLMDRFSDRLIGLYQIRPDEFMILLTDEKTEEKIIRWFTRSIRSLVDQHYLFDSQQQERDLLTGTYAKCICTGIKTIFNEKDISIESLSSALKTFLHSFIVMLDSDFTQRNDAYSFYHIPNAEKEQQ